MPALLRTRGEEEPIGQLAQVGELESSGLQTAAETRSRVAALPHTDELLIQTSAVGVPDHDRGHRP